jgi:protein-S-isoprenylcysteine O-methyltransferase Ste14
MFRMIIKTEYKELEKVFGESYLKYKRETPEFFPFPLKKLFR